MKLDALLNRLYVLEGQNMRAHVCATCGASLVFEAGRDVRYPTVEGGERQIVVCSQCSLALRERQIADNPNIHFEG